MGCPEEAHVAQPVANLCGEGPYGYELLAGPYGHELQLGPGETALGAEAGQGPEREGENAGPAPISQLLPRRLQGLGVAYVANDAHVSTVCLQASAVASEDHSVLTTDLHVDRLTG